VQKFDCFSLLSLKSDIYHSMTTMSSRLDSVPQISTDYLVDVINWLKEGDYVIIHDNYQYARYFHSHCDQKSYTDEEITQFLDNCRVIYFDVRSLPGLLKEGEWEWYIKNEGHAECNCQLKTRCTLPAGLPHSYHLNLDF